MIYLVCTKLETIPRDPCGFRFELGRIYGADEWSHAPGEYILHHSGKKCPFHNTRGRFKIMERKFIIHYTKSATTIQEVLCEEVFTHSWELRPGEKRYRILSKLVLDKDEQYPIWYSWAVHDSAALALNSAAGGIRTGMERAEQKGKGKFDETELAKQVAMITVERLENEDGQGK